MQFSSFLKSSASVWLTVILGLVINYLSSKPIPFIKDSNNLLLLILSGVGLSLLNMNSFTSETRTSKKLKGWLLLSCLPPLIASGVLYTLIIRKQIPFAFVQMVGCAALFLFVLAALLPTGVIFWLNQQRNNPQTNNSSGSVTLLRTPYDWRRVLLAEMETNVTVRLDDSLHNQVLIRLQMQDRRQDVGRPQLMTVNTNPSSLGQWLQPKRWLKVVGVSTIQLNQGKKIIEVFEQEDIAGRLLILGTPGSGKTTTLLELARDLIERAQSKPEQPIPVLFELSSWKDDKQPIADWLIADLKSRKIPEVISREWLDTGKLLPLLDGLDELGLTRQAKCIKKINDFLQAISHPSHIVVCCRDEEYIQGETILGLRGAVCLQPLEPEQIKAYLEQVECPHLWKPINEDPEGLQ